MKRREFMTPLESAASNTYPTKQKEEVPKKNGPEPTSDSPPIDLWDDAVNKLIRGAKKRGYVTHVRIPLEAAPDSGMKGARRSEMMSPTIPG